MKLNSKIQMFEEFNSTEKDAETAIDSKGAVTTTPTTTILDDVDHILGDLETLSKQIDEDIENLMSEFDSINEAEGFMDRIMKEIKSAKAYGVLTANYRKYLRNKNAAEIAKKQAEYKFEEEKDKHTKDREDMIKQKFQNMLDKVSQSNNKPSVKSAKKDKIRDAKMQALGFVKKGDEYVKDEKAGDALKRELELAKAKMTKRHDNEIRDRTEAITELGADNTIESELMKKRWSIRKLEIDDEEFMNHLDAMAEVDLENITDEDRKERIKQSTKQKANENKAEFDKRLREREQELQDIQNQYDQQDDNASQKEKDARKKIKDLLDAHRNYLNRISNTDFNNLTENDITDIEKKKKTYTEAKDKVTVNVYKASESGMDDETATDMENSMSDMLTTSIAPYKTKVRGMTKNSNSTPPPPAQ